MEKKVFSFGNSKKNMLGINDDDMKYVVHNIDLTATNDSHSLIINDVIKNTKKSKNVLDIGCNTGSIGIELNKHGYTVDGIEYSKKYYDLLKEKKIYNNLYNISVSDFDSKEFNNFFNNGIKYDFIIFADVLEHLVNPDEVIYKLTSKLKPSGKMIISIPNIAHIDIIINLINGNFNYAKEGLLDNTHLRFFTSSSFAQMIDNIENNHNIYYELKQFARTKVIPEYLSNDEKNIFDVNSKDFEGLITIQNLFELSLSKTKQNRKYSNKSLYENFINEYKELIEKNNCMNKAYNDLLNVHNIMVNSRWWKLRKILLFWKKK